jgi:chemotaxis protein methyltransferase CheR
MSAGLTIERAALEALAALLLERAGLKITPDGYYGLRLALQARMPALGLVDASEYVRRLRQLAGEHELRALLPLVTVGKTEFFRDARQFGAFESQLFPQALTHARREGRAVKLWSAGCATGEEPYSIAMVGHEQGALLAEVDIWATDLNPLAVENASRGFFPERRMLGMSEERLARFFSPVPGGYEVNPLLRTMVRFDSHNLAAPAWPQLAPGSLDVIFCRNVIIYFDQPTIVGVMQRFFEALRPGGWLLLGYSESLFKVSTRFAMTDVGGTFAYRRLLPGELPRTHTPLPFRAPSPRPSAPSGLRRMPSAITSLPPSPVTLTPPPRPVLPSPLPRPSIPPPPPAEAPRTPVERLNDVVACIEEGDFPRALRTAKRLADDVPDDLAARLTLGNVHALMGNIDEAREAYGEALSREPLCVEARVYLAMAAMQVGLLDEARLELTRALFLEPTLVLGHYLLGQVSERRGDPVAARRAYRNAMAQRRAPPHELIGHFPDLPRSNEAIAQAAQYRLAALSES